MAELWDLFDRYKNPLNKTQYRGMPLEIGEYHLVVNIMTVNSNGEILVTKRDEKKHYGGKWEITGGSKIAGETSLQGAKRELYEETGIKVCENELEYKGDYLGDHWFHDYYLLRRDIRLENIVLQKGETVDAKLVTPDELLELMDNNEFAGATAVRLVAMYPEVFEKKKLVEGVDHVSLKACGKGMLEKAIDFYCKGLGLSVKRRWDGGVMIDAHNCVIEIFETGETLSDGVIKHFALGTGDVDKCVSCAVEAGAQLLVPPQDREIHSKPPLRIRMAFVRGVLGEQIEFFNKKG